MAYLIMKASELFVVDNFMVLRLEDEEEMKIDLEWLRDHCRCSLCFNTMTHQRKLTLLDFPSTIRPDSFKVSNGKLDVTWNDGHDSTYNINWLKRNIRYEGDDTIDTRIPWTNPPNMEVIDYESFMNGENGVIAILKSILQFGIAMIVGAKPNLQVTEEISKKIGPVQKTLFGEMWELNHDLTAVSHKDSAYTHDSLDVHTDNTYWSDAAGLQIFHCYKPADSGGETLLIDGLKIVEDLKVKHRACYERLCKTPVSATYIEDGQCHEHVDPIIKLHPVTKKLLQIR
ncbi:trimethyllysine dioxygenase, mitochondrial isoform X2 [Cephus cinctus]|uniref:trimethyllysine dioxygenase n=1 Tax=Cephus cinctus TaxID=211228 RepID=A0AAJ7CA45_CEPCN|nr:trimethyllysine dioxygenase, mitochondrial isoform X2 [Cephus cinctus]